MSAPNPTILRFALVGLTESESFIQAQMKHLDSERARRDARRVLRVVQSARGAIIDSLDARSAPKRQTPPPPQQLDLATDSKP